MSDLFRRQSIENLRDRLHGDVVVTPGIPQTAVIILLLSIISVGGVLLYTGSYDQKETVYGWIEQPSRSIINVYPSVTGVIKTVGIREGQSVKAGDVLMTIEASRAIDKDLLKKTRQQILIAYQALQSFEKNAKQLSVNNNPGLSLIKNEALYRSILDDLELQEEMLTASINDINTDAGSHQQTVDVLTSMDGTIGKLLIEPGDAVSSNMPVGTVIPHQFSEKGSAILLVPVSSVGAVREGQSVRLRYDAFPSHRFGFYTGVIDEVASNISMPDDLATAPINLVSEPVYKVQARLDQDYVSAFDKQFTLKPGMTLAADIIIEKRTILNWLIEPVLRK